MRTDKKKQTKLWLVVIGCLIIILPVAWFLMVRLEGQQPVVEVDLTSPYLGSSQEITVSLSDEQSGLRSLWVGLLKDGKETVLYDEGFPSGGLLKGGSVRETAVKIPVTPKDLGFADGKAVLRMIVRDYAWRDWWKGNRAYAEKQVVIDTRPPGIEVLSRAHNISQGGSGLAIFRTSEECAMGGVQVGDRFYPGHTGFFKDAHIYLAFFALGYDQGTNTPIHVVATDLAGNQGQGGMNYHILHKSFRKDRINISDGFLNSKMPEFSAEIPQGASLSPLEKFLFVNRDMRKSNYTKIVEACRESDAKIYWKGAFLRLPKSASRARFADHRTYFYKGKEIDRQVHLGMDLASVANSPVPAANAGVVVLAAPLGIYGNTVIIDHGFDLFSMYSHLSYIGVKPGDQLAAGQILGRTGATGMAGGDHLHFSMIVHDTFVNPVEWWDDQWIEHNVTSKIEQVKGSLN